MSDRPTLDLIETVSQVVLAASIAVLITGRSSKEKEPAQNVSPQGEPVNVTINMPSNSPDLPASVEIEQSAPLPATASLASIGTQVDDLAYDGRMAGSQQHAQFR